MNQALQSYALCNQLGHDEIWARFPALLQKSKPSLLSQIKAIFKTHNFRNASTGGALWNQLAMALAQSCHRPYHFKGREWSVPPHITPQLLRDLKIDSKDNYLNTSLENAAKQLEKEPVKTEVPAPPQEVPVPDIEPILLHFSHLDFEREKTALGLDNYGDYITQKTVQVRQEIESIKDVAERTAKLIEPPHREGQSLISRLPYWRIWKKQASDVELKTKLWPRVGPALWARYEEKLEEYRRVETDDPAPKLEEKLTPNELKNWKTEQRRIKRQLIQNELTDIAALLREVEGFEAETRLLKLLQRPGVKEVAKSHAHSLLQNLSRIPYSYPSQEVRAQWWRENLFLDSVWVPIVAQLEATLLGDKRMRGWETANHQHALSLVFYRLNTEQSRAKFRELASQVGIAPYEISGPVVALGDVESWLLLIETPNWNDNSLKELWTRTRQNPDSEDARRLTEKVLQLAATTSHERGAKFMLEMLDEVPVSELETHTETIVSALESPIIPVKRWALKTLPQLMKPYDEMGAATLVGEMLWNENGALAKDAAKFLGAQEGEAISVAWDALQDAASLENQTILEAIFRALTSLKKRDNELQLNEAAQEKLTSLCEVSPDRFGKFAKKLGGE